MHNSINLPFEASWIIPFSPSNFQNKMWSISVSSKVSHINIYLKRQYCITYFHFMWRWAQLCVVDNVTLVMCYFFVFSILKSSCFTQMYQWFFILIFEKYEALSQLITWCQHCKICEKLLKWENSVHDVLPQSNVTLMRSCAVFQRTLLWLKEQEGVLIVCIFLKGWCEWLMVEVCQWVGQTLIHKLAFEVTVRYWLLLQIPDI